MHTARALTIRWGEGCTCPGGVYLLGCVPAQGGVPARGVPVLGGRYLPGGYLCQWCTCPGGVCAWGVYAPLRCTCWGCTCPGVYLPRGCVPAGGVPAQGDVPARSVPAQGGVFLPRGGGYLPRYLLPPWTEFLTHASENITLPQTSFAGGNDIKAEQSAHNSRILVPTELVVSETQCISTFHFHYCGNA